MFRTVTNHLPMALVGACTILVACGFQQPLSVPPNLVVSSKQFQPWPPAPVAPPNASPRILRIWISTLTLEPGSWLNGAILTTSNAASVEVRTAAFSINSTHVAPGMFRFHTLILELPPLARRHTYPLNIIARNAGGAEQIEVAPLTIK